MGKNDDIFRQMGIIGPGPFTADEDYQAPFVPDIALISVLSFACCGRLGALLGSIPNLIFAIASALRNSLGHGGRPCALFHIPGLEYPALIAASIIF